MRFPYHFVFLLLPLLAGLFSGVSKTLIAPLCKDK
ncbi:hypothetical protein Zm00014a_012501 [Zea mays]|uniref:Uncharacterized protein n=1 Tax=Zea mays TaxID=4577 RepID=A0A3L6EUX8_MAIZE|nr:hypothetical protein Zm00014a_012501 [Zea mays]